MNHVRTMCPVLELEADLSVEERRRTIGAIERLCNDYVADLASGISAIVNISYTSKVSLKNPRAQIPRGLHFLTSQGPELVAYLLAELRRQRRELLEERKIELRLVEHE